jgi:ubiquitin-protein ligase
LITASIRATLTTELRTIQEECRNGLLRFTVSPKNGRLSLWDAGIRGPDGSTWSGATLKAELHFPDDCPNSAPTIYIKAPNMHHPNVSSYNKHFCLYKWMPNDTIISAFMTVQAVLVTHNPASPRNNEAAHVYRTNQAEYERRVQFAVQSSWGDD